MWQFSLLFNCNRFLFVVNKLTSIEMKSIMQNNVNTYGGHIFAILNKKFTFVVQTHYIHFRIDITWYELKFYYNNNG